jgi:curved DNA-binding protein CbpA
MNYYVLLGVSPDADPDAIRSAFRARARQYHPDAGEGSSVDRFREILIAYETLNDSNRRGNYDRFLQNTRTTIPRNVEPLRQPVPEPMLSRQRVVDRDSVSELLAPTRLSALVYELFQSWEECSFEISDAAIIFERPSGSRSPVSDML